MKRRAFLMSLVVAPIFGPVLRRLRIWSPITAIPESQRGICPQCAAVLSRSTDLTGQTGGAYGWGPNSLLDTPEYQDLNPYAGLCGRCWPTTDTSMALPKGWDKDPDLIGAMADDRREAPMRYAEALRRTAEWGDPHSTLWANRIPANGEPE